ncbi:MAG: cytochrome c family protein [Proteobacteria bacterium]|nr:cytochrome c family protein [Pseudomonadota bacterium]
MNSYELNKIFGAVVGSVLAITVIGYISNLLVHPHQLEKSVLDIKIETAAPTATAAAPVELPPIAPLLATADAAAGAALTRNCTSCHTFEKGGRNGVGPNLFDIVGNKKAHIDGFAYSPGVAAKGGQWDYEDLNHFLANPRAFIPGTRMAYAGMRRAEDRANLIAHLRTLSDSPKALP